jgi:hypothetical protein
MMRIFKMETILENAWKYSNSRGFIHIFLFSSLILTYWAANANTLEYTFREYRIIEGDIEVPIDFDIVTSTWAVNLWPNGIIPYEFDDSVEPWMQTRILNAITDWESVANIDFIPRANQSNYVRIIDDTLNSSAVGMQGGEQNIRIFNWLSHFVICHELGHCLGYWHEQSRPDRDTYVWINWENIPDAMEYNFERHDDAGQYGMYDFLSIMHYGQYAFAEDPTVPTIIVLPPDEIYQDSIGQRSRFSYFDTLTMSFLYSEPDWRFVDQNHYGDESGTFLEPFREFLEGEEATPNGGILIIQPGNYSGVGIHNRRMTIRAPLGSVIIGN